MQGENLTGFYRMLQIQQNETWMTHIMEYISVCENFFANRCHATISDAAIPGSLTVLMIGLSRVTPTQMKRIRRSFTLSMTAQSSPSCWCPRMAKARGVPLGVKSKNMNAIFGGVLPVRFHVLSGCVWDRLHCGWSAQNNYSTSHFAFQITTHYVIRTSDSVPCFAQNDPFKHANYLPFSPAPTLDLSLEHWDPSPLAKCPPFKTVTFKN